MLNHRNYPEGHSSKKLTKVDYLLRQMLSLTFNFCLFIKVLILLYTEHHIHQPIE